MSTILKECRKKSAYELWNDVTRMKAWQFDYYHAMEALQLDAVVCPPNALPAFTHGARCVVTPASLAFSDPSSCRVTR